MDHELHEAYTAICAELGLAPASQSQFRDALAAGLDGAEVVSVGSEARTWILVRGDARDGCTNCLTSVAPFIDHFYSGDEDVVFADAAAAQLLVGFHRLHDLSIAVTNAYGAQNWSCVVAASDCPGCADARLSITPPALRNVALETGGTENGSTDIGGDRAMSPEVFVGRNRWAFGFASVVGNPVAVPEAKSVSLVNAPIRTSVDVLRCEIAGGKGISLEQALASCLGEAFERYALATANRGEVVTGESAEVDGAIDVASTFGFPVVDEHPSISLLTGDIALEWMNATDLTTGRSVRIPANFALCPYSSGPYAAIVAGSTNGAACGATGEDARAQGLREIVERDAFWYYARTGVEPVHLDLATLPREILAAMGGYDGTFAVTLLPNPFDAPVANVAFVASSGFQTRSARGSGHASTVEASIRRAFAECIQMLYSLDSGIEVDPVQTDMRSLWFSGQAPRVMPNLFVAAAGTQRLDHARERFRENQPAKALVDSAARQGLAVFEIPLVEEHGFAVAKVVMSGASVTDATYFATCERLDEFASFMRHPDPEIRYSGSLFM